MSLLLLTGGLSATPGANAVEADKTYASASSDVSVANRTVTVTVNDADINLPGPQTDTGPDRFATAFSLAPNVANNTITLWLANYPIADRNADGAVNSGDVDVVAVGLTTAVDTDTDGTADFVVQSVDASNGGVVVRSNDSAGTAGATAFQLNYNAAVLNDTTDENSLQPVTVTSNQDVSGFTLQLGETNNTSGLFSASFTVADIAASKTTFSEVDAGADLNGDGDATDTGVAVAFYEAKYATDLNGDGDTTDAVVGNLSEVAVGVDLNGDGDATDTSVESALYEALYGVDIDGDTNATSKVRPIIAAPSTGSGTVTITYADLDSALKRTGTTATDTVAIESTGPTYSELSPADGHATTSIVPQLVAQVTDTDAGVTQASIAINVKAWTDANADGLAQTTELGADIAGSPFNADDASFLATAITGGFQAQVTLPAQAAEVDLAWNVESTDGAFNTSASDSKPGTAAADTAVSYHALSIDNVSPALSSATTGHTWAIVAPATTAANNAAANDRTSVKVTFNERLDAASVTPSDFTVAAAAPSIADVQGAVVYLTVATQAPDAKPAVALVGEVLDRAGNKLTTGTATSADGVAPAITVAVDKALAGGDVIVTITSDEAIVGSPALTVGGVGKTGLANPSALTWTRTVTAADAGGVSAKVTVDATGSDSSGNAGNATDVTYELDLLINNSINPTLVISGDAAGGSVETSETSPFVRIQFTGETLEYVGDTNADVVLTALTLTETESGATTANDAVDYLASATKRSATEYVLALTDLNVGSSYAVSLNATDTILNTYGGATPANVSVGSFAVIARPQVTLSLQPGMNLISLPEIPVESGINEVFPAASNVDVVMSYDPSAAVPWLVSQRDATTGLFGAEAEVQTLQVGKGYWVQSTGFNDVLYSSRAYLEAGVVPPPVPPAIKITGGQSNLVGFVSLEGGASMDADTYFQGVTWQVGYTFAPDTGWAAIRPGTADTVNAKEGVILFASADGWVTP